MSKARIFRRVGLHKHVSALPGTQFARIPPPIQGLPAYLVRKSLPLRNDHLDYHRTEEMARKRAHFEAQDDDGFVVDDDAGTGDSKRAKVVGPGDGKVKAWETRGRDWVASGVRRDEEGNAYWEISQNRRVQVSSFKGKCMVSFREYFEKGGMMFPGKKGISLPMEQFAAFVAVLPEIESALEEKGERIPKPRYDKVAERDEGDAEGGGDPQTEVKTKRKNHEATSEEEGES